MRSIREESALDDVAWARRVAARVAGGSHADDLAQDALLAALRGRGPRGDRRRWLAGILRNLARMERRGAVRRARREAAVARRDATPSASQLAEGAELRERVGAALAALPEPVRRAVRARYLEERTCAAIARAEGVPESTIRNRVRRGLLLLRTRLAREYDGDPRMLLLALVPCRRRPRARVAVAAGVLFLLGFAWPASAATQPAAHARPPAPAVVPDSPDAPLEVEPPGTPPGFVVP